MTVTAQGVTESGYLITANLGANRFMSEDAGAAFSGTSCPVDEWGELALIKTANVAPTVPDVSSAKVAPTVGVGAYPMPGGYSGSISGCGQPNVPGVVSQATGAGPVGYTPVEDACQIKYSNWPSTGTTITNEGLAGSAYNAVASANKYQLQPSGAAGWVTSLDGASVYIPHGSVIDNPSSGFTVEMMFSLNGSTAGGGSEYVYYKNNFRIYFVCYGQSIYLYRVTTDGYRYIATSIGTRGGSQFQGAFLFVQITWDGSFANYPIVYINNQKVTFGSWNSSGSNLVWADDSSNNAYIVGGSSTNRPGTLYLFRYHNRILSDSELTQNWNADRWRWQQGFVGIGNNKPAAKFVSIGTNLGQINANSPVVGSIAPYETGCTLKYDFSQPTGTVTNLIDGTFNLTRTNTTNVAAPNGARYDLFASNNCTDVAGSEFTVGDSFSIEFIHAPRYVGTLGSSVDQVIGDYTPTPSANGWQVRYVYPAYNNLNTYLFDFWTSGADTFQLGTGNQNFNNDQAYHLVFTFDRYGGTNNVKWYLNGALISQTTRAMAPVSGGVPLSIGHSWAPLNGALYLVRVFNNVVLTLAQVLQNYQAEQWRYSRGVQLGVGVKPALTYGATQSGTTGIPVQPLGILAESSGYVAPTVTPVEDACQVKFSNWPANGTTVTNEGLGGVGYNGVATRNETITLTSGAKAFYTAAEDDGILTSHGSLIDNVGNHTLEFLFRVNSNLAALPYSARLFNKQTSNYGYFIWNAGASLQIVRYNTDNVAFRAWTLPALVAGNVYFIQITWDSSVSSTPVCYINNVSQSLTYAGSGTTTVWRDDSGAGINLANAGAGRGFPLTLALFRFHNRILTPTELTTNYNADAWRMGVASMAVGINKPAANLTVPDVTDAKVAPQTDIGVSPASPSVVINAAIRPSLDVGSRQTVVPNAQSAASKPAIDVGPHQSVVPNVDSITNAVDAWIKKRLQLQGKRATTTTLEGERMTYTNLKGERATSTELKGERATSTKLEGERRTPVELEGKD